LLEVGDVDQDVSTPDEIDGAAGDGKRFGGAADELDLILQRSAYGRRGKLDVPRDRINAGDAESKALGELNRVHPFPATDVDGNRAGGKIEGVDELVQKFRSARLQALVERRPEVVLDPRIDVVELV